MKCSIQECPGHYEERRIVHAVRNRGRVLAFEQVPAEVCSFCGDTLFTPETVGKLDELMAEPPATTRVAPLYKLASGKWHRHLAGEPSLDRSPPGLRTLFSSVPGSRGGVGGTGTLPARGVDCERRLGGNLPGEKRRVPFVASLVQSVRSSKPKERQCRAASSVLRGRRLSWRRPAERRPDSESSLVAPQPRKAFRDQKQGAQPRWDAVQSRFTGKMPVPLPGVLHASLKQFPWGDLPPNINASQKCSFMKSFPHNA